MIFRFLIFIFLLGFGYYYAQKIRGSRFSIALVSTLLVAVLAVIIVLGRKLFAMFSFSMYLMLMVLGLAAGILAGLGRKQKQLEGQKQLPAAPNENKRIR